MLIPADINFFCTSFFLLINYFKHITHIETIYTFH